MMDVVATTEVSMHRIADADPQGRDVTVIVIAIVRTPAVACAVPMGVDMYVIILVTVLKDEAVVRETTVVIRETKATATVPPNKTGSAAIILMTTIFTLISTSPFSQ